MRSKCMSYARVTGETGRDRASEVDFSSRVTLEFGSDSRSHPCYEARIPR